MKVEGAVVNRPTQRAAAAPAAVAGTAAGSVPFDPPSRGPSAELGEGGDGGRRLGLDGGFEGGGRDAGDAKG